MRRVRKYNEFRALEIYTRLEDDLFVLERRETGIGSSLWTIFLPT